MTPVCCAMPLRNPQAVGINAVPFTMASVIAHNPVVYVKLAQSEAHCVLSARVPAFHVVSYIGIGTPGMVRRSAVHFARSEQERGRVSWKCATVIHTVYYSVSGGPGAVR